LGALHVAEASLPRAVEVLDAPAKAIRSDDLKGRLERLGGTIREEIPLDRLALPACDLAYMNDEQRKDRDLLASCRLKPDGQATCPHDKACRPGSRLARGCFAVGNKKLGCTKGLGPRESISNVPQRFK
jgi:hypothetical protein